MLLREGGIYVDGEGSKIGPMEYDPVRKLMRFRITKTLSAMFTIEGYFYSDGRPSSRNIVGEWVEDDGRDTSGLLEDLDPNHFRRGIAKTWDSYKLLP